ncbi:MAG: chemotaxis protein CheA [Lentisphaerales bacterium]|nr:chemotaxis protein CheA [Lentisphaerales bacterium]
MGFEDNNSDLIDGFVMESRDALEMIDPLFIEVIECLDENQEVNVETLNGIFRLFHTMKGSAGFLNLNVIVSVNHEAETLLDLCRSGKAELKKEYFETLLQCCDIMSTLLDGVEEQYSDENVYDVSGILELLRATISSINNPGSAAALLQFEDVPVKVEIEDDLTGDEFSLDFDMLSPEIIEKFVQEGLDLLDEAEGELLAISRVEDKDESLESIIRQFHTFKGNCGFMSFAEMQEVTHCLESIVEGIRVKQVPSSEEVINTILNSVDQLKMGLFDLLKGGKGALENCEVLLNLLESLKPREDLQQVQSAPAVKSSKVLAPGEKVVLFVEDDSTSRMLVKKILEKADFHCIACETAESALDVLRNISADVDVILTDINLPGMSGTDFIAEVNSKYNSMPVITLSGDKDRDLLKELMKLEVYGFADKPVSKDELLQLIQNAISHGMRKKIQTTKVSEPGTKPVTKSSKVMRDIRVDLTKLDTLIDLVGELIIAESMVTKHPDLEGLQLVGFERAAHRLHLITNELQDIAMAVRMVPVSGVFKKMLRLVHDVSLKIGKPIKLHLRGEETEVDKVVVDMIADPLVHMIRNSADHGIEPPEERQASGKPEQGNIILAAEQRASEVLIIIQDDGRGLNKDKILEKSRANGLLGENDDSLTEQEICQLIFEPGFSTAAEVTDLSGRGVGMDVVKKNIEKVKGRIEIKNSPGKGCKFIIHIPLTLATIEGMLVKVGSTKYTIPITAIRESLRPSSSMITVRPDGQEFVKIRENILPVFRLYELHDLRPDHDDLTQGILIVLDLMDGAICLFVDSILHQVQTVIKSLSGYMGSVKGISGCNILGNGEVALILDPESILKCLPSNLKLFEAG